MSSTKSSLSKVMFILAPESQTMEKASAGSIARQQAVGCCKMTDSLRKVQELEVEGLGNEGLGLGNGQPDLILRLEGLGLKVQLGELMGVAVGRLVGHGSDGGACAEM